MQTADRTLPSAAGLGPIVFNQDQIHNRVAELGMAISRDHPGRPLVIIGVLTGTVMFVADLLRALEIPVEVDFISISRFGPPSKTHAGVRVLKDLEMPLSGRHAILVETLVDTGFTLSHLLAALRARHPSSLRVCALLSRSQRRLVDVPLDFVGFEAPDENLVGYGLHYQGQFRHLPYIASYIANESVP